MKKVEFPHNNAAWDKYRAFHTFARKNEFNQYGPHYLTLFDTGELIAQSPKGEPWVRGHYPDLGVSLLTTHDVNLYKPDGEPVPKAQLNYEGTQQILVDWDTRRAVGIGTTHPKEAHPNIPERFVGKCAAYIPGPGQTPVGNAIKLWLPLKQSGYSAEEQQYLDEYVKHARVAMTLMEHRATRPGSYWDRFTTVSPNRLFEEKDWQKLNLYEQQGLFHKGVGRRVVKEEYLVVPDSWRPTGS